MNPMLTIFWTDSKKDPDGEPVAPVTQEVLDFGIAGPMLQIVDTNQMLYLIKLDDIDTVAVQLPTAPEATADTSEEEPTTPLIHLPTPPE